MAGTQALALADWANFYVILGSAAAALTGLTFIVITLAGDAAGLSDSPGARVLGMQVFIRPTIVHFTSALLIAALLSVPRLRAAPLAAFLGCGGVLGMAYTLRVAVLLRRAAVNYRPFLTDWLWNVILPAFDYLLLVAAGLTLPVRPETALYATALTTVMLLLVGIHNAWDVVAWITTERHAHPGRTRRR